MRLVLRLKELFTVSHISVDGDTTSAEVTRVRGPVGCVHLQDRNEHDVTLLKDRRGTISAAIDESRNHNGDCAHHVERVQGLESTAGRGVDVLMNVKD